MARNNKNYYRYIALHELGNERAEEEMNIQEIMTFINNYKNNKGRLHRHVNSMTNVIVNLMYQMPEYDIVRNGTWVYTPKGDE
jgi:hypothetical protein|tara:strand:- start:1833 stop:2081 length:249 start_codon:yes stop_codon:yes gene_type:complete